MMRTYPDVDEVSVTCPNCDTDVVAPVESWEEYGVVVTCPTCLQQECIDL